MRGVLNMEMAPRSAKRKQHMKISISRLTLAVLAGIGAPIAMAANLQSMNVASLPGDRVELKFSFDEPVSQPRGYTIDQPARIAIDLPGVSSQLDTKKREIGVGNARSVAVVEAADRTRLIVNLTQLVPYSTRVEGNNLFVLLGEGYSDIGVEGGAPVVPVRASQPVAALPSASGVANIDFQRSSDGAGNVLISLTDPSVTPAIEEKGGKIVVSLPRAELPEPLRVRLDVQDFATPVKYVSASEQGGGAEIVIEPSGAFDYLAFQADSKLTISVKPLKEDAGDAPRNKQAYSGEKLSLNFQDIDVRSVLQLIADFTNLNLVASDTVQGNITLRLQNVPWDQALDLVLKTKGLDKRQSGNVLLVAPAEEIAARELQELQSQRQVAELAPLRRELVQVNYAKAADIAKLFASVADNEAAQDDRGSIAVDDRTNSIIAYQTEERLEELRRIVAQLDIPVRQVMIEARIVEANVNYDKSLGVRWGGTQSFANDRGLIYGRDDGGDEEGGDGPNVPFVDLGAVGANTGIGIGYVTDNLLLDLELSAMESSGNGEVVSQPKVVTADKETAKILKGSEIPYQEASSSGATAVSFKEAALSLEVTPQITPDNRIIMEVKVNKDAPDFANSVMGVPPINTNEVNAKVLVNDGETIVLGGVFNNVQEKVVDKVPFLGDLPFIGRLFRRDTVREGKEELLIFLTPRILNGQAMAVNR